MRASEVRISAWVLEADSNDYFVGGLIGARRVFTFAAVRWNDIGFSFKNGDYCALQSRQRQFVEKNKTNHV